MYNIASRCHDTYYAINNTIMIITSNSVSCGSLNTNNRVTRCIMITHSIRSGIMSSNISVNHIVMHIRSITRCIRMRSRVCGVINK